MKRYQILNIERLVSKSSVNFLSFFVNSLQFSFNFKHCPWVIVFNQILSNLFITIKIDR